MLHAPALRVADAQQVTNAYIRHYQGALLHVCRRVLSPSVVSLKTAAAFVAPAAPAATADVYVVFAACGDFKLHLNGKFVLQSNSKKINFKLYGAYVTVSLGGVFAISLENGCRSGKDTDFKGFIGCIGSSVCTGLNDGQGWWCIREQPAQGWMLPFLPSHGAEAAADEIGTVSRAAWAPARSQGTSRVHPFLEQGLHDQALFLWSDSRQGKGEHTQVHCRWTL